MKAKILELNDEFYLQLIPEELNEVPVLARLAKQYKKSGNLNIATHFNNNTNDNPVVTYILIPRKSSNHRISLTINNK